MTTYETRCPWTSSFHSYFSTSASIHPVCLPTIQGTKKKKFLQSTVPVKPTITPHYHWYIYEEPDLPSTVTQNFVTDEYSKSSNPGIDWIFYAQPITVLLGKIPNSPIKFYSLALDVLVLHLSKRGLGMCKRAWSLIFK